MVLPSNGVHCHKRSDGIIPLQTSADSLHCACLEWLPRVVCEDPLSSLGHGHDENLLTLSRAM